MKRAKRTGNTNPPAIADVARKNLPAGAGQLIANVANDITIPFFNGVLTHADDTLIQRGGGKGLKIYDEIERDTHAYAMLQKRKKALLSREWEVRPASDSPLDIEAADFVREVLDGLAFDRLCEDLLDATLKGFAVSEIVWARTGNRIVPGRIVTHEQRRFVFDAEGQPRLLTFGDMWKGEELPARKFIVHRFGVKGNNPYGLGLGTRLFWPVLFKREGIAFWLHFLEKFAGPTVVGKTPYSNITDEQRKLLRTLQSVRTSSAITVPVGTDIEFLEASRSGTVSYQDFLAYWDKQISICVTGETLTTDIGKGGSRAAAETHAEILEMLVDADADLLTDTLRESLCQWLIDHNLPGAGAPSIWRTRPENEEAIALTRTAKAGAAKALLAALETVLRTVARIEDDVIAREIIVTSGAADHLTDAIIDHLVTIRTSYAQAPAGEDSPGVPSGAPKDDAAFAADGSKKKNQPHCCFARDDGPVVRITDALTARTAPYFTRRLKEVRKAIDAPDYETASRNLLDLAAKWTPDQLARQISQALELAALEGREAVFADAERRASFAADPYGVEFREQIDFLKQKRGMPTRAWTDAMYGEHDRAFVIAGATNLEMIEEFHRALISAVEHMDIVEFGREFDRIVEDYGWNYNGGRDWRVRVIFETNVRTSHMAGRLRQMRDPDVVSARPYWQYLHGETRIPLNPRPLHLAWDGMVLMHDDPWWNTYFPPNDWRCSCGVRSLSERDLRRLGKIGPDQAPEITLVPTSTGRDKPEVMYPEGAGYGWAYQPGDRWDRGLVPSALEQEALDSAGDRAAADLPPLEVPAGGRQLVAIDEAGPLDELLRKSPPLKAPMLPAYLSDDALTAADYVRAFLDPFGADIGRPVLWDDVTGARILISDDLFRDRTGGLKLFKQGRERHAAQLAEAIMDPDEIWLGIRAVSMDSDFPGFEDHRITRHYLRGDGGTGLFTAFDLSRSHWTATTGFKPGKAGKTNWNYLENRRVGKRLWKRK